MKEKIKVAFIKFGGLSAGGTERFLQTVAANLDRHKFEPFFFYCQTAPYIGSDFQHPGTDENRKNYMINHGVNLVEFRVEAKDVRRRTHPWIKTDFWQKFNPNDFHIIQTGRAGHPEYPFNLIKNTPIVDSLHLNAGVDNQYNISRVMHISQESAERWVRAGGDKNRVILISHPVEIDQTGSQSMKSLLGLEGKFVYGFHQRVDNNIFSPIPLEAYKKIENPDTAFILLGGGTNYKKQAEQLGLKNIIFLPHTGESKKIYSFLLTLDVYSHGRKDGEVNSVALAEAMYFGLPIVSHISKINNGHVDQIAQAGRVLTNIEEYAKELKRLKENPSYRKTRIEASRMQFQNNYDLKTQMEKIEKIYEEVIKNPFPHKITRFISSFRLRYYFNKLLEKICLI